MKPTIGRLKAVGTTARTTTARRTAAASAPIQRGRKWSDDDHIRLDVGAAATRAADRQLNDVGAERRELVNYRNGCCIGHRAVTKTPGTVGDHTRGKIGKRHCHRRRAE